jgi:uncharacterized protein (DUF1800 family)
MAMDDREEHDGAAPAAAAADGGSAGASTLALASVLALSACGGGGGGSGSTPQPPPVATPPPPPPVALPTRAAAARFLSQATMGFTRADIDRVAASGFEAWLTEQFAMGRETSHWDWLVANGYANVANRDGQTGFDPVMWRQLIASPDQLRQRVGMALLDILVVSIDGINASWRQFVTAAYVDILLDNAFGNYRTLLERVSLSPAMGYFLTYLGNRKANPQTGAVPDENYARELMQLFTIGLVRLGADGSVQMSGGRPIETYGQDDIAGLARVFTGWTLDSTDNSTPDRMRRPMIVNPAQHETGAKTFLGATIPAGTDGPNSLRLALDAIFAHPNVAPFISKQLIQRLVTSNPPPGYVSRVAAVFENNGQGVRGDLRAVVRAILLDVEARSDVIATASSFGKLRAPINRLTAWARAFGATSPSNAWAIGNTSSNANRLGQSPGRAPSVFNFYRPGYTPPGSPIASAGLVAPEFQITNEPTVVAYVNYMATLVATGAGDFRADYAGLQSVAGTGAALIDEVDLLLGAGLSAATKTSIAAAVDAIATGTTDATARRIQTAVLLTLAAPEYLVQR